MNSDNGSEPNGSSERLAPVIPLFGRGATARGVGKADSTPPVKPATDLRSGPPVRSASSVSPARPVSGDGTPSDRHPARGGSDREASQRLRGLQPSNNGPSDEADDQAPDPEQVRVAAEEALVRKLRSRSLSVSEARQVLRGHGIDAAQIDEVIDDFLRRSYLDDAALAQTLVTSGAERKGQGRVALSRSLAQRGIPRDVIATALDELPDDDAERALDFARTKARSLSRLDHDTALRRLVGQLSRRGYNGAVAMRAAKTALGETSFGGRPSGVHFVESD